MQTDMTVGKPMKMILDFTIPVFIGNVFQQFYNMADAIIVGKFVGTKGLAAVGSTGTIMFLIIGFLTGLTAGFTVLTSQKFGAGKMDEMRQSVVTFNYHFGYNDGCQYGGDALASDINAYTRGYFSGCIYLHYDHMRRYFCTGII